MATNDTCACDEPATLTCSNCNRKICADNNCGQDTVDGYMCGSYTQWGCSRKYTTCDICLDDKAIHEGDLAFCEDCGNGMCEDCCADDECSECDMLLCGQCAEDHECDGIESTESENSEVTTPKTKSTSSPCDE